MNKTAIFIDAGHLHYHLYNKWKIDYKKLIDYFVQKGYLPFYIFYYEGMMTQLSYFSKNPDASINDFYEAKKAKKKYFNILRSFEFIVHSKPVHRLFDHESGKYKFKCNFDVEITVDIMETVLTKDIDIFIICSGDGDFTRPIKYLKSKAKKVVVAGFKENINPKLLEIAHEILFLEVIREKIEYK